MTASVPHEDSPDLTPLAQEVANPFISDPNGNDSAKLEVDGRDADPSTGGPEGGVDVKDEEEDMDEMDSDGEGDAEDYERERARIIRSVHRSRLIQCPLALTRIALANGTGRTHP